MSYWSTPEGRTQLSCSIVRILEDFVNGYYDGLDDCSTPWFRAPAMHIQDICERINEDIALSEEMVDACMKTNKLLFKETSTSWLNLARHASGVGGQKPGARN